MRGMSKNTTRSPECNGSSRGRDVLAAQSVALGDGQSRQSRTASGSRQDGRLSAMSPPTMKVRACSGTRSCSALRVSTVYDAPPRSISRSQTETSGAGHGEAAQLEPDSAPGSASASLCGGWATGISTTRSSASWSQRLLGHHEVADVRRVEGPAEDPDLSHRDGPARGDGGAIERARRPRPRRASAATVKDGCGRRPGRRT